MGAQASGWGGTAWLGTGRAVTFALVALAWVVATGKAYSSDQVVSAAWQAYVHKQFSCCVPSCITQLSRRFAFLGMFSDALSG